MLINFQNKCYSHFHQWRYRGLRKIRVYRAVWQASYEIFLRFLRRCCLLGFLIIKVLASCLTLEVREPQQSTDVDLIASVISQLQHMMRSQGSFIWRTKEQLVKCVIRNTSEIPKYLSAFYLCTLC